MMTELGELDLKCTDLDHMLGCHHKTLTKLLKGHSCVGDMLAPVYCMYSRGEI